MSHEKLYVVVTGANRPKGIGLALVREFHRHGAVVVGTFRSERRSGALLRLAKNEDRIHALQLDVCSDESVKNFSRRLRNLVPTLDILINNAGMGSSSGTIMSAPIEALVEQIQTHAIGPVRVTKAVADLLRLSSAPRVVTVSSVLGTIAEIGQGHTHYAPCKAAANALTLQMSATLHREGVCVFSVHPGWVSSDIGGSSAPVSPANSARGLYREIIAASLRDTGTFTDFEGEQIEW